ncbi:NADPH oxidase 4-like [Tetranychus urticae]|uniref:FAD-binding FR-type domain-containing protein n=1 Tax=Tetranychus urticae TaxID=32264 RepID=T1KJ94_TETUR|nr:NADPH oxidase 4-like [Tetranychus urticae]
MMSKLTPSTFTQCQRYIKLYLKEHLFMIAWTIVNLAIFGWSYFRYKLDPAYHYTHQTIGHGLFISRGTASVLNFSCFIIFIPMCRTLLTSLRSLTTPSIDYRTGSLPTSTPEAHQTQQSLQPKLTLKKVSKVFTTLTSKLISKPINKLIVSMIDRSQQVHIASAYTICLSGLIHSIAHIINSSMASINYNHRYPTINLASFPGQHPFLIISGSVAGVTGIAMNLVLMIVFITSTSTLRRDNYNLFKYSHFLTIIFVILIICHPLGGLLKEQTNLDQHTIGCDEIKLNLTAHVNGTTEFPNNLRFNLTSQHLPCDPPIFKPLNPCTWIWLSFSLFIYTIDIVLRLWRRRKSITLINSSIAENHINLELAQIKGNQSIIKHSLPGQYVYLKCPRISTLEWHPFSLSSIPIVGINETFNLNIKLNGDWTNKLGNLIDEQKCETIDSTMEAKKSQKKKKSFKLYIDGPFSSPLQDLLKHKICVCIAGGIGATPFISFLSLFRSYPDMLTAKSVKIEKLYFIWICRNVSNLSGFIETLAHVYGTSQSIKRCTQRSPFRLTIYLTQESQETMLVNVNRLVVQDEMLINKLLRNSIFLGKPKLRAIFQQLQRTHQQQKVSVFCSGPLNMRREVKKTCHSMNLSGSHFVFKHEDFGF